MSLAATTLRHGATGLFFGVLLLAGFFAFNWFF